MSEYKELVSVLGTFGLGAIVGGIIVLLIIKNFIPSYLKEKGKNLATKEDIGKITSEVESVKLGYSQVLEEIKSEHALKQSAIDREKSIKKEVYFDAVEAITKNLNLIASFPNLSISNEYIAEKFSEGAGKIAKVQIVGSKETVKSVSIFMSAMGGAILDLLNERGSLLYRKSIMESINAEKDKSQAELDRYLSIMKNLNLEGNYDNHVWDIVNRGVDFESERVKGYLSEVNDLSATQGSESLVYARKCMNEFFKISELLPAAVLSVRKELDLDISDEDYLDIVKRGISDGRQKFEAFVNKLDTKNA